MRFDSSDAFANIKHLKLKIDNGHTLRAGEDGSSSQRSALVLFSLRLRAFGNGLSITERKDPFGFTSSVRGQLKSCYMIPRYIIEVRTLRFLIAAVIETYERVSLH